MKKNHPYIFVAAAALVLAVSCSEKYEINKPASEITYLAVESIISDVPGTQTVKLTESIPYAGRNEVKGVSGAVVTVSDVRENTSVRFAEHPEHPGVYCSPADYSGLADHTYHLKIERDTDDGPKVYDAYSTMRRFGFDIQKIDYKYTNTLADSVWTLGVWGTDDPDVDNYMVIPAVNGYSYPIGSALPLPDKYFNGAKVWGFPITVLTQTWRNVKEYGLCSKPLETGDIVTLVVYDMPKDFYYYMTDLVNSASTISIPIISSQPANLPTNLSGDNVVGFFSTCAVRQVSCVVDDPYRTKFLDEIAAGL